MSEKRNTYKTHKQSMLAAEDIRAFDRWKLLCLKGDSDFLTMDSLKKLKKIWEEAGWMVDRIDGLAMGAENFLQATAATSLFESKVLTVVYDAQQAQELSSILGSIQHPKDIQKPLILVWRTKDIPSKIQKELIRIGALWIHCDEPLPWEIREFVQDRCRNYKTQLNHEAIDLFLEAMGSNLSKIDHELSRLSLIFHNSKIPITAELLRPHLTFLREDHVFKLDLLLCQESFGKALLLVSDLLKRGESPLGLLAILSMHCRKALQIQAGLKSGQSSADLARQLKLPQSVIQNYLGYVQRRSPNVFSRALTLCHEADWRLKSRGFGEDFGLSSIILELKTQSGPSGSPEKSTITPNK